MTATNHVITGALIASIFPNPIILPVALLSHFVLDALPHFGLKTHISRTFVIILLGDMTAASLFLLGLLLLQPANWLLLILAAISAASPDLMWFRPFVRDLKNEPKKPLGLISRFHSVIQWSQTPYGAIIEVLWAAGMLWLLIAVQ